MKALFFATLISLALSATAAEIKYPASEIPEALKKNVGAVVREHDRTISIPNQKSLVFTEHSVVTILSAAGKDHATVVVGYDKLTKVNAIRATIYDATGKVVRKVKSSEFADVSNFEGLYSDTRVKYIDLAQSAYPYTIEYDFEITYKFLFFVPGMNFIPDDNTSVQSAKYTVVYANGVKPRYYTNLIVGKGIETTLPGGLSQTSWKVNDLMPPAREAYGPVYSETTPYVLASPSTFEYEGYVGSMDTWDGFGKWVASLLVGRQNLPEATKAKAKELCAKATTVEEKTRILYNYLQNKTRYVSVQLGIGGFQPFDAATVDNVGYGDCKALSNYMVALLSAVGIKSHYAMIDAGPNEPPVNVGFVSQQFNHAVVAVPNGQDTIWLECTSQVNPFAYSGRFTGNRKAVIVTDKGAQIAQTPHYDERVNTQIRKASVIIQDNGNASAKVATVYSGLQYENGYLHHALENELDVQKKWVQNDTQIPSFELKGFTMKDHKDRIPSADVEIDLTLNRFASLTGKRMFVTANLMNRFTSLAEKDADRKSKVFVRMAYTDIDTVEYTLSESLYPEFVPDPIKHKSRFGEYEASAKLSAGKVIYVRKLTMREGEYPAESYSELVEFYKNINRADNMKLVFLSKT